jgi:hypothetical protein
VSRSQEWIKTSYNNQNNPSSFYTIGDEESVPQDPVVYAVSPVDRAVGVPTSLTQLNFTLVSFQGSQINYTVSTYPNIGSGNGTNVQTGMYAINVNGMNRSTKYDWNVTVTDGIHSDTYSFEFTCWLGNPPNQDNPNLTSTGGKPPLVCYPQNTSDIDGDKVTNIFRWYRNNVSITNLQLDFDTNNPSYAKDYSGYGNDGTIVGNVAWTPNGVVGGAYTFNNGFIKVLDGGNLDGGGQWTAITVEFWFSEAIPQNATRIIAKIPSYEVGFTSDNKLFAGIWINKINGYRQISTTSSVKTNTWYHVVLTYKSGTGITLYLNGSQSAFVANVTGNIKPCKITEPLYIGWFDYFKGTIDEVRIYPRCLSSNQVKQRWNETKAGLSSSSTIVSNETTSGESWRCEVIPNDSFQDGQTKSSNTVTIGSSLVSASQLTDTCVGKGEVQTLVTRTQSVFLSLTKIRSSCIRARARYAAYFDQ